MLVREQLVGGIALEGDMQNSDRMSERAHQIWEAEGHSEGPHAEHRA